MASTEIRSPPPPPPHPRKAEYVYLHGTLSNLFTYAQNIWSLNVLFFPYAD